jgi:hypothetical protein
MPALAWQDAFMTRNTVTYAAIGNGIYVRTKRTESLMDAYRRLQRECEHTHWDSRGQCYRCGNRKEA